MRDNKSENFFLLKTNFNAMLKSLNLDTISSWGNGNTRSGLSMISQLAEQQSSYAANLSTKSANTSVDYSNSDEAEVKTCLLIQNCNSVTLCQCRDLILYLLM